MQKEARVRGLCHWTWEEHVQVLGRGLGWHVPPWDPHSHIPPRRWEKLHPGRGRLEEGDLRGGGRERKSAPSGRWVVIWAGGPWGRGRTHTPSGYFL